MEENKNIPPKQRPENIPEVEKNETPTSTEEIISSVENILPEIEQSEIPPLSGTETIETSNTAKENDMEVHHHTHPDSHRDHGKKNWKSYFWEFLMLFLAVFCGFLAEYQLEHTIENQREKKYIQSFIYDLQNDTANLNMGFPLKDERVEAIDSIFLFFEKNPDAAIIPGAVFRHMQRSIWDRHYRRNSTTIDQLKNAGGMRLIRKKNVADSIAAYDLQWIRAEFWREAYITNQEKGKYLLHKIFNANDLLLKYRNNSTGNSMPANITDSMTIRIYPAALNEYLNFLYHQKNTIRQDKRGYQTLVKSAERLIDLIKKEYHLE